MTTLERSRVDIDQDLCIWCGLCREACPEGAIHPELLSIHHRFEVLEEECTGCGVCLDYCPVPGALVTLPARIVG